MILHTHLLLHLYLILIVLDYLSLINTKSRFEKDKIAKSKKMTEEDTVWKRLRKKLRRPHLDYQDCLLLWIGCITFVNWRYLVREFHRVRYPVCRTTDNWSWNVLLQWYSFLTLSTEDLVGFCCDSYCAYSDTEVKFKYFELHIDCQFSKRGVIYLFHSRKIHISSKGKSDTWVIALSIFDFFTCWHKYFVTWFYIHTFYCIYI